MTNAIFGPGFDSLSRPDQIRRTAQELEAVVLTQLLSTMRSTVSETDLFGKSPGHDVFQSMMDAEIARETAKRSPFGLADAITKELEKQVKADSEAVDERDRTSVRASEPPPTLIRDRFANPRSPAPRSSWRI
ncbi:MAG: rod-binding protein [Gemmatimonadetes bacterium]|nr:rod-binding protein [Gemmatimonadota bacterium]